MGRLTLHSCVLESWPGLKVKGVTLGTTTAKDVLVKGVDDLLEPFHAACKPASEFRIGTEAEKFGWLVREAKPLPFHGETSVQSILKLLQQFGWQPEREHPQGEVIALLKDDASITLEPAGQLELSGAPFASLHDTHRELEQHFDQLRAVSDQIGISWLSLGFHPFAKQDQLPHVPKLRYGIMERYLPTRGSRALDMMRRTCTVQANLDFSSEEDAMRKLRVSLALQPIVTGMFANSPFYEGRLGERASERADVWLNMDATRTGLLPFAWEKDVSFQKYVEWALDAPMFLIKRNDKVVANTDQTFREYLQHGSHGERATSTDWRTHLNTLFPEVRLKNTLEMRGADAQGRALTSALPALWKGLLYSETALRRAESLIAPLSAELVQRARPDITRLGLQAILLNQPLSHWASEVVQIARAGLDELNVLNDRGESESFLLDALERLVREGRCPADVLRSELRGADDFAARVVSLTAI
jgi:glutamate--cysteine ligase